jgi:hypothetical protein
MLKITRETLEYAGISIEYGVVVAGWKADVISFDGE